MDDAKSKRFMGLLEPRLPRLQAYAFSLSRSREDAKDLVSDTVIVAWERFETLKEERAFLSFLFTVASRLWNKRLRKKYNTSNVIKSMDVPLDDSEPNELLAYTLSRQLSPEDATDIVILYEALDKLEENIRQAIILFYIMDMTVWDIAKIQGTSIVNVKVRLFRGRKRLREILEVEDPQDLIKPKISNIKLDI